MTKLQVNARRGGDDEDQWIFGDDTANVIDGGAGRDRIWAGGGDDVVTGGEDRDRIWGQDGNDRLDGGDDRDRIWGGDGDDTIIGGAGRDRLTGGAGADMFIFGPGTDNDRIRDFENGIDRIDLAGFGFAGIDDVLALAVQKNNHVLIRLSEDDSLRLDHLVLADLDASDFLFA